MAKLLSTNEAAALVIKARERGEDTCTLPDLAPGVTLADIERVVKQVKGHAGTGLSVATAAEVKKVQKAAAKKQKKSAKKARKRVAKSDCSEADAQQEEMTGERPAGSSAPLAKAATFDQISSIFNTADARVSKNTLNPDRQRLTAARAVYEDPKSTVEAKAAAVKDFGQLAVIGAVNKNANNGGDVQPDVNAIPSISDLHELKRAYDDATDPAEKQTAGYLLTKANLEVRRALDSPAGKIAKSAVLVAALQSGDAGKGVSALVAADQQRVTAGQSASLGGGVSGGAGLPTTSPGRQRLVGVVHNDLGAASQTGNRGDVGSATSGGVSDVRPQAIAAVVGGEGAAGELVKAVNELHEVQAATKVGSITDREVDLRETITRLQLAISHGAR